MKDESTISDKKLEQLSLEVAKTFSLNKEEALEVIYEEWDSVEALFLQYEEVKSVHENLIILINDSYRIA